MSRQVFCSRLKQQADGMDAPPFRGEKGEQIFNHISKQAWNMWLGHQTMLINEYRLSVMDPSAREFLATERDNYLFGDGNSSVPAGFTPPDKE